MKVYELKNVGRLLASPEMAHVGMAIVESIVEKACSRPIATEHLQYQMDKICDEFVKQSEKQLFDLKVMSVRFTFKISVPAWSENDKVAHVLLKYVCDAVERYFKTVLKEDYGALELRFMSWENQECCFDIRQREIKYKLWKFGSRLKKQRGEGCQ